jgi:hypothetical protein
MCQIVVMGVPDPAIKNLPRLVAYFGEVVAQVGFQPERAKLRSQKYYRPQNQSDWHIIE